MLGKNYNNKHGTQYHWILGLVCIPREYSLVAAHFFGNLLSKNKKTRIVAAPKTQKI